MEIHEIKAFVLLAEYLHFGRTAKLLNITQPALSKQINKLELFLGNTLFERDRKSTQLTAFGRQFLKEAQGFMAQYENLCILGQKISSGEQGLLRIGFSHYALEMIPLLIVKFRQDRPGIELVLKDLSTHEQLEALRNGQLDIGFVKLSTKTEFETLPLVREQLTLITPHHPDFNRLTHLEDCSEIPFVIISKERSPVLHNQILGLCANYGFYPRIVQEVAEVTSVLALVKAGLGVSILPPSFFPDTADINLYPQTDREARWSVFAAWKKDEKNPALAAFLALLKQEMKDRV